MFKGYFIANGRMPFVVGKSVGYFDILAKCLVGRKKDAIRTQKNFAKLCRAIIITETRGLFQLESLLKWSIIKNDKRLHDIFQVIYQDEPSHIQPYRMWLSQRGYREASLLERSIDFLIHYTIAMVVIPAHFLNFRLKRAMSFSDS